MLLNALVDASAAQPVGSPPDVFVGGNAAGFEYKLDGARVQIHRSGDGGDVYSRDLNIDLRWEKRGAALDATVPSSLRAPCVVTSDPERAAGLVRETGPGTNTVRARPEPMVATAFNELRRIHQVGLRGPLA